LFISVIFFNKDEIEKGPMSESPIYKIIQKEYRIIFYIENYLITVTIIGTREGIYKLSQEKKKIV